VDDQHTENGRKLIRREAEAVAAGLRVGEVLHSPDIEASMPGLGPVKKSEFGFVSVCGEVGGGIGFGDGRVKNVGVLSGGSE